MTHKFLNLFWSIAVRAALVVALLVSLTGAAIIVGYLILQSIQIHLAGLEGRYVPDLRASSRVISATDEMRDGLTEVLIASDPVALTASRRAVVETISSANALIAELGEEATREMLPLVEQVQAGVSELVAAREAEFAGSAAIAAWVERVQATSRSAASILVEAEDAAFFDLTIGGEETVAAVEETLTKLVEQDFEIIKVALETKAEISLLSGIALAMADGTDPALRSIYRDLAESASKELDRAYPKLESHELTAPVVTPLRAAHTQFRSAISANDGKLAAADVLPLRQAADAALTTVLDDIAFALMFEAEDATDRNEASIRALLETQVARMRETAAIAAAAGNVVTLALEAALAGDAEIAQRKAAPLEEAVSALLETTANENADLVAALGEMSAAADPQSGIVPARIAQIEAETRAAAVARAAADSVGLVARAAKNFGDLALDNIDLASNQLDAEVALASARMRAIIVTSIAASLGAIGLVWLQLVRPIRLLTTTTERLATGNTEAVTGFERQRGEIARMGNALTIFRDGIIERERLRKEERERDAAIQRAEALARDERRAAEENKRKLEIEQAERDRQREMDDVRRKEEARKQAEAERAAREAEQARVVTALAQGLKGLASGDLRVRITEKFEGGYEQLRQDFNLTVETLADLIHTLAGTGTAISSSSGEISSAALDLSRRTEATAAALEESAAALNELTASVTSAADGARHADGIVRGARSAAEASSLVVGEAVDAMDEIENSSRQISKITSLIEDIAFQTNLLALNAGVEAARAGDAGRGFAVVASEVRALAQRSSEAAREINSLISTSNGHVQRGVDLVGQAGRALGSIVQHITEISSHVGEIAASAQEQSIGISEINSTMAQLDQSTQQNAAMFEETTAASRVMSKEAENLADLISRFELPDTTPSSPSSVIGTAA